MQIHLDEVLYHLLCRQWSTVRSGCSLGCWAPVDCNSPGRITRSRANSRETKRRLFVIGNVGPRSVPCSFIAKPLIKRGSSSRSKRSMSADTVTLVRSSLNSTEMIFDWDVPRKLSTIAHSANWRRGIPASKAASLEPGIQTQVPTILFRIGRVRGVRSNGRLKAWGGEAAWPVLCRVAHRVLKAVRELS